MMKLKQTVGHSYSISNLKVEPSMSLNSFKQLPLKSKNLGYDNNLL